MTDSIEALTGRKISFEGGNGPEVWLKHENGINVTWGRILAVDGGEALVSDRDGAMDWFSLGRLEFRAEQDWGRARPTI